MSQTFISRNVEPGNLESSVAVMKNKKGNKELGKLLGLGQGKGRHGMVCLTSGATFLPERVVHSRLGS